MSRVIYKNPPITEAVCEFRFSPDEWDITWPGELYSAIKKDYPQKPRQYQEQILEQRPDGLTHRQITKVQFLSTDGTRTVSVGPGTIAIHDLYPYSSWEQFSLRIFSVLSAYQAVINNRPLIRVGLRYINRIDLRKEKSVELDQYFSGLPNQPEEWPSQIFDFLFKFELAYPDGAAARIFWTSERESEKNPKETSNKTRKKESRGLAVILDIDVYSFISGKHLISGKEVEELVTDLRQKERTLFESTITDKTRKLFNE